MMDLQTAATAYLIGIPCWAFIMSLMGVHTDRCFFLSIITWPIAAISLAGQLIRVALGKSPFN